MNAIIPFFRGRERGSRRTSRLAANRRRSIMLVEQLEGRQLLSATTYTVVDTGDTAGSFKDVTLRYAITQANLNPGSTIEFALTESFTNPSNPLLGNDYNPVGDDGLVSYTFTPNSPLPAITSSVTIDGTYQNFVETSSRSTVRTLFRQPMSG
jgi:hypothetical protein